MVDIQHILLLTSLSFVCTFPLSAFLSVQLSQKGPENRWIVPWAKYESSSWITLMYHFMNHSCKSYPRITMQFEAFKVQHESSLIVEFIILLLNVTIYICLESWRLLYWAAVHMCMITKDWETWTHHITYTNTHKNKHIQPRPHAASFRNRVLNLHPISEKQQEVGLNISR